MCKVRLWTPQDRRFVVEVKEALIVPHLGPSAMPRKAVAASITRSEGWYSRVLNAEELDWMPDLVDLRRIITVTGNQEPARVVARWMGEGATPEGETNPFLLLALSETATSTFNTRLARLIADGDLSREDAKELLPLACRALAQLQTDVDALRKRAGRR
jgi:hypothetical protein